MHVSMTMVDAGFISLTKAGKVTEAPYCLVLINQLIEFYMQILPSLLWQVLVKL